MGDYSFAQSGKNIYNIGKKTSKSKYSRFAMCNLTYSIFIPLANHERMFYNVNVEYSKLKRSERGLRRGHEKERMHERNQGGGCGAMFPRTGEVFK